MGTILKTYREILNGASSNFFETVWHAYYHLFDVILIVGRPKVKLSMNHFMTDYDTEVELNSFSQY
jgi:hypothetical protein